MRRLVLPVLFLFLFHPARAAVLINEFMSSNGSTVADEEFEHEDWIELYNNGEEAVDLGSWGLSDSAGNPFKWRFPEGTLIGPQGYLLVWASGKNRGPDDDVRAGILREVWLNISGTTVNSLVSNPRYPSSPDKREMLTLDFEAPTDYGDNYGQRLQAVLVAPQTGNYRFWIASDDQSRLYLSTDEDPAQASVIAQVDGWTNPQEWGKYPSQQSAPVHLVAGQRYYVAAIMKESTLGDNLSVRWQLPDNTIEEPIPASYFVSPFPSQLHTSYRISSSGEPLVLTRPDGQTEDSVPAVGVPRDVSYGRLPNGGPGWSHLSEATPGAPNTGEARFMPPTVAFSEPRGFKTAPFQVIMTSSDPGATIRYTTDGSEPGPSSTVYTGPVTISQTTTLRASANAAGMIPLPPATATYLFLEDVLQQGASPPPGWPAHRAVNNHRMFYGFSPAIVNNDGERLRQGMTAIPSISIVTDLANLFDPADGIYSNSNRSHDWERPVSVELIDPEKGASGGFQADAGLQLRGAFSRSVDNPKHSLRLFFRSSRGEGALNFPLFGGEGASEFSKIDLRTEQNYSWAFQNDDRNTFLREVFSRDSQRDMGMPYTRSRYYHLYINGQYWGLYMTQERGEADWASTYLGGDSDDWDCIKTAQPGYVTEAADGNINAFYSLHKIAVGEGFGEGYAANYWRVKGMNPDGSRNPDYPVLVDEDNLINYMLLSYYVGDRDAPVSLFSNPNHPNNLYGLINRAVPDGFKWLRHDAEHSLGAYQGEGVTWDPTFVGQNITARQYFNPATLHWRMAAHPDYRMRFADLVQKHLYGDGALTPENAKARVQSRAAEIDLAIVAESARWGSGRTRDGHWVPARDAVLSYLDQRRDIIVGHFRNRGWYPSIDAPRITVSAEGVHLGSSAPFYYMTDGSDPRLPGGGIRPGAQLVNAPGDPIPLIGRGSVWRYFDLGSEPPEVGGLAWCDPDYPDTSWSAGPAVLGFAGAAPQVPVATQTRRWITGTSGPQVDTTYLRREFTLESAADITGLVMEILRDDGAVIYLNGVELLRENMPGGAVGYGTWASSVVGNADQTTYFTRLSDAVHLLRPGVNVLAVSVHQANAGSTDKYFDISVAGTPVPYGATVPIHQAGALKARAYEGGEWSPLAEISAELPAGAPIHSWNFEGAANFLQPSQTAGGAGLTVQPGPQTEVVRNTASQDFDSAHLRINNPLGAEVVLGIPTSGYQYIRVEYDTRRSGSGAGEQTVEYTTDGETWTVLQTYPVFDAAPQRQSFNFANIPAVDNNPDFALRITFALGSGGTAGNNRFDNIVVSGTPVPGAPVVNPGALPSAPLVAGQSLQLDLAEVFTDGDSADLDFSASSSAGSVATVAVQDGVLTVTPLAPGEVGITVTASDGQFDPVSTTFTLLVYPAAHDLAASPFTFTGWGAGEPAMTYPEHMIFLQSGMDDPGLTTTLGRAYQIPLADAAAAVDAEFPYAASSRTRINGLGVNGIAFINTGRGRDVGAALVALDTTGVGEAAVTFTAGTVTPNVRLYAIRLQYRVGTTGDFTDVTDAGGQPVEYVRNAAAGHAVEIGPVELPSEALGQSCVQLLWRYHFVSGASGARAQLRLDNITVAAASGQEVAGLVIDAGALIWAQTGQPLGPVTVRVVDADGLTVTGFDGEITLALTGDGNLGGTVTVTAQNGVAVFDDLVVGGGEGAFVLEASLGGGVTAQSPSIGLSDVPVFLPAGNADWTADGNWTSPHYPDAAGEGARILAPAADRNVNIWAPVTIGHLRLDAGTGATRHRLRDRGEGNTLTFDGGGGPARLSVGGAGEGHVEMENVAGTILATDLEITVDNTEGNPEFGALRLRETWSGPGGLAKKGAGVASLTGGGKLFGGEVVVEQGVLALTQPSSPSAASALSVLPGGQLRLTSANDEFGARVYTFGGALGLSGSGRSGVGEGEGLGVLGALRYEPGSHGNEAVITTPVALNEAASVHVAGENVLRLSGGLSGGGVLSKSGAGRLHLGPGEMSFLGGISLARGGITFDGADFSGNTGLLAVADGTVLRGNGRWGGLLQVASGGCLEIVPAEDAPFEFGAVTFASDSVVRVLAGDLDGPSKILLFRTAQPYTGALPGLDFDNAGPFSQVRLIAEDAGLYLVAASTAREAWLLEHDLPADGSGDGADLADPDNDGIPNLLERAFALDPRSTDRELPVGLAAENGAFYFVYRVAGGHGDLQIMPQTAVDAGAEAAWRTVPEEERQPVESGHPGYELWRVPLPSGDGRGFGRIRVESP